MKRSPSSTRFRALRPGISLVEVVVVITVSGLMLGLGIRAAQGLLGLETAAGLELESQFQLERFESYLRSDALQATHVTVQSPGDWTFHFPLSQSARYVAAEQTLTREREASARQAAETFWVGAAECHWQGTRLLQVQVAEELAETNFNNLASAGSKPHARLILLQISAPAAIPTDGDTDR